MSQPPQDDWDEHDVRGSAARYDDGMPGLGVSDDHDESLADEMLEADGVEGDGVPRRRKRSPLLKGGALLLALALVVVAGIYSFGAMRTLFSDVTLGGGQTQAADYEGPGTGEVLVDIPQGAAGGSIAEILAEQDVVASASAFTAALAAEPRAATIQPGTYRMAEQMSSQAALSRLLDGSYREINGVTVREGLWVSEIFQVLAEETDHEVAEYEDVDPGQLDLPEAAEGELEGFLFPSTYEFPTDATPQQQLQMMIDQGKTVFAELGLEGEELRETLIKASIVQGEGLFAEDLPKIARVMENRLEGNSETYGLMQMDSTVHYIYQERGRAGTTEDQRADESPYNTYVHTGLPPGPINNPGQAAIEAAMNPEPGDWVYFVTVNPSTGETKFAATYDEHLQNVQEFEEWCRENQDESGQC